MKRSLFLLFFLIVSLSFSPNNEIDKQVHDIYKMVNKYRKGQGLKALKLSKQIYPIALKHSKNMASGRVEFGHDGFKKRAEKIQSKISASSVAENVAYGNVGAEAIVEGWLNSPGHRKNIEGDYTLTAIGIAKNRQGLYYYTQIFAK